VKKRSEWPGSAGVASIIPRWVTIVTSSWDQGREVIGKGGSQIRDIVPFPRNSRNDPAASGFSTGRDQRVLVGPCMARCADRWPNLPRLLLFDEQGRKKFRNPESIPHDGLAGRVSSTPIGPPLVASRATAFLVEV
jgi:hypothetical protein